MEQPRRQAKLASAEPGGKHVMILWRCQSAKPKQSRDSFKREEEETHQCRCCRIQSRLSGRVVTQSKTSCYSGRVQTIDDVQ